MCRFPPPRQSRMLHVMMSFCPALLMTGSRWYPCASGGGPRCQGFSALRGPHDKIGIDNSSMKHMYKLNCIIPPFRPTSGNRPHQQYPPMPCASRRVDIQLLNDSIWENLRKQLRGVNETERAASRGAFSSAHGIIDN